MAEETLTVSVAVSHSAELIAEYAGDPIVARQALVQIGIVGSKQVEDASILPNETGKEDLRLAAHRIGELLIEIREPVRIGMDLVEILKPEPLSREPRPERLRPRIPEHATYLFGQHTPVGELPRLRDFSKPVVRRPPP